MDCLGKIYYPKEKELLACQTNSFLLLELEEVTITKAKFAVPAKI